MKKNIFFLILSLQVSCTSIGINLNKSRSKKNVVITSFTHYSHYFIFGLFGLDHLDLNKACTNHKPVRVENYYTIEDILFIIASGGIYTPKSTRIWCELPLLNTSSQANL